MISKIKDYFLFYIVGISIFGSLIPHICLANNKLDGNILNQMYSSRITDSNHDFINNLKTSSPNTSSSGLKAQEYSIKQQINCSNYFQLEQKTQGERLTSLTDKRQVMLVCEMASQEEVEAFEDFLMTSDLEYYELAYDNHKCALTDTNDNQQLIQCIFMFSITLDSPKKSHFRVLSDETQQSSENDTSESQSDFLSVGMSDSTLVILLVCVLLIILFGIIVCLWMKKKKKRAQNIQGDKLVLIKTATSPRGSVPELTSPMAQLNLPNQMFPTDPNTNLSPAHSLKSVPNIKLDGKGRSSEIQDENMFTNIDSPRSVSDASSRTSAKNAPKALDFNIEFSMVEQESVMRMKNNLKDKKKEY